MSADLLRPPQNFAEQPFATASADRHLPAIAAPVDADAVARAKALAAGLKIRLRSARLPAQVVEVAFLLEESRNPECPLLERIRILGLLASRLDHYFAEQAPDLPESQSQAINAQLEPLQQQAFTELQDTLLPALAREYGILVGRPEALNGHQREFLRRFFRQQLYPMLTPLAVDPGHPFPFISSHSINLLVHLNRVVE